MNAPPRRRRRRLFIAIALGIGLLLGGLASEIALRCHLAWSFRGSLDNIPAATPTDPARQLAYMDILRRDDTPMIGFTLRPGARGTWLGAKIETNSLGFRDDEIDEEKTSGTLRVLGLGDSTMFGWGVEKDARYFDIVERETRRAIGHARKVEFLDMGVPAYMTVQEVACFEKYGLPLRPDAVIIQFDLNDISIPYFLVKPNFFRLDNLYLARLRNILNGDYKKPEAIIAMGQERFIPEPWRELNGWGPMLEAYKRLRDLCAERNILLWAVIPAPELLRDRPELVADPAFGYFRGFCVDQGIRRVETYWDMRDYAFARNLSDKDLSLDPPRDPHPTPLRHALMAYSISKEIIPWLAYGVLTAEEARATVGDLDAFLARNLGETGVYGEEDWNGQKVRWATGNASFSIHPKGRTAVLRLWIGHPDVAPGKTVRVTASLANGASASGEFDRQGLHTLRLGLGEGAPKEARINVVTSRTFRPPGDSRELGVALFPVQYE